MRDFLSQSQMGGDALQILKLCNYDISVTAPDNTAYSYVVI